MFLLTNEMFQDKLTRYQTTTLKTLSSFSHKVFKKATSLGVVKTRDSVEKRKMIASRAFWSLIST